MAAANTDKFKKVSRRWTGQIGSGGVADGVATTIPLASSTNLPTDTAVVVVIDRVDVNGAATAALEETAIGVVSGTNLINCVRGSEGTAQAHLAGAVVEILVTAKGLNDLMDGILVEHNQDGTHSNITASSVTINSIAGAAPTAAGKIQYDSTAKLLKYGNGTSTLSITGSTDGWTSLTDTWTYSSADGHTFVVSTADQTAVIGKGDRIKFTNNSTTFYGICTAISSTTITLYGGTAYSVANSAITAISYSHVKVPFGFNPDPIIWTDSNSDVTDSSQSSPVSGTWYNHGGSLAIPIGDWDVSYKAALQANTTSQPTVFTTLSTANNSESDTNFTCYFSASGATSINQAMSASKQLLLATKTTYYLNDKYTGTSNVLGLYGSTFFPSVIKAVCAYL